MTGYRLYFMNPRSGHIDRYEDFDAFDDSEARNAARLRLGEEPAELWSGHRKVERFALGSMFGAAPRPLSRVA